MTVDLNDETHTAAATRTDKTDTDLNITEKQDRPQVKKKERKRSDIQVRDIKYLTSFILYILVIHPKEFT
jgi:hypothetical protein